MTYDGMCPFFTTRILFGGTVFSVPSRRLAFFRFWSVLGSGKEGHIDWEPGANRSFPSLSSPSKLCMAFGKPGMDLVPMGGYEALRAFVAREGRGLEEWQWGIARFLFLFLFIYSSSTCLFAKIPRFLGVESNPSLVGLDHCCRFWHYVPGEMDVNRPHVGLSSSWATLKMGVCLCVCVGVQVLASQTLCNAACKG